MITIAQAVREASADHMERGNNLWAALSKTKPERLRSSHAGKIKGMVLETSPSEKDNLDVEWNAGSVWLLGSLLGSALRTRPLGGKIIEGKTPQAWLDTTTAARVPVCSEAEIGERWERLMDY